MGSKTENRTFSRIGLRGSLRLRLATSVVGSVLVVMAISMVVDYQRAYRIHIDGVLASLEEQARALQVARRQILSPEQFPQYVNDFCAQMNAHISPGHHILVLDPDGKVIASSRHHSGVDVEKALLAADSTANVLSLQKHRLAQIRLKDDDGTTFIMAQYLDHVEEVLRGQLLSRTVTMGTTAVALITLIFLALHVWATKPVARLTEAAKAWSERIFSTRVDVTGPTEVSFLTSELNSMAHELERHERDRNTELEEAKQIQANLMPVSAPTILGLAIATEYRPAGHVAGDLYDIFTLPDGRTAIVILDVCGHGISAALLTGVVKMSLHRRLAENSDISEAMKLVNDDLRACTPEGHFVTACVGCWDHTDQSWTYCAAGHPGGMLLTQGQAQTLAAAAPLLGVFVGGKWLINRIDLSVGDRVFLYTDGVLEIGITEDKLATFDLVKILNDSANQSLDQQVTTAMTKALRHNAGIIEDDATIVAFEVLSAEIS